MDGARWQSGRKPVCHPPSTGEARRGPRSGKSSGGLLFGYFLLAAQEKVTCMRGSPRFQMLLFVAKRHYKYFSNNPRVNTDRK